jgi:hypothetical protein
MNKALFKIVTKLKIVQIVKKKNKPNKKTTNKKRVTKENK